MQVTFEEISLRRHMICGAFLFYKLSKGLYKRYLITACKNDVLELEEH